MENRVRIVKKKWLNFKKKIALELLKGNDLAQNEFCNFLKAGILNNGIDCYCFNSKLKF